MRRARLYLRSYGELISPAVKGARRYCLVALGLQAAMGACAAVYPVSFRLIINSVLSHDTAGSYWAVALAAALFITNWALAQPAGFSSSVIGDRAGIEVTATIAQLLNQAPGVEHLERPEFLRELAVLDRDRSALGAGATQLLFLAYQLVRAFAMVAILATVNVVLVVLPLLSVIPVAAQSYANAYRKRVDTEQADRTRLATRLFQLCTAAGPAKELRVSGVTGELERRHDELARAITGRMSQAALVSAGVGVGAWLIFAIGYVLGVTLIIVQAVDGRASVGDVVMAVAMVLTIQLQVAFLASSVATIGQARRTAERLVWLRSQVPGGTSAGTEASPSTLSHGIDLDHVSFRYPGTTEYALTDVSLHLPARSTVAIVGENGAGKTTLVKLLSRLYEPTTGQILVEGRPLASLEVSRWRSRLTTTFQDFMRFELQAQRSVGIGDMAHLDDRGAVHGALERSGSVDLLEALPEGLDTLLGSTFVGGQQLSEGQWQKVALSRGNMRQEPLLLVLDEPTASLDATTEHAIFEQHVAAARQAAAVCGSVTILISHRFSTVRMADRIVVLQEGRVDAVGTHRDLLRQGGLYAELFSLQAQSYR